VRVVVPRLATRAQMLVARWFGVVAVVLLLPTVLLVGSYGAAGGVAAMAVGTAWQWLAFRWIDHRRAWHSIFD
jgi:O-antigen/teichoic acid export membrane protein